MKGKIKKFLALGLAFVTISGASFLTACGQKNPPEIVPPNQQEQVVPPETQKEIEQELPIVQKVQVQSIIDDACKNKNYAVYFENSLKNVANKTLNENVTNIELKNFLLDKQGKVEIEVEFDKDGQTTTTEIEYAGDTTGFDAFRGMAENKETYINSILTELNLKLSDEIEKDSQTQKSLESEIAKFDTQKENFEKLSFTEVVKEPEVIEYVTVQEIVDEAFAGVDFDADLKNTAQCACNTAKSPSVVQKIFVIDIKEDKVNYYMDRYFTNLNSNGIYEVGLALSNENKEYFAIAKDFEGYILDKLADKGVTLTSQMDKKSQLCADVTAEIDGVKNTYLTQKAKADSCVKAEVSSNNLFTPKQFTNQEMEELGISSMDAFADALLNNEKGTGFDKVTGWTTNDVVATFVTEFNSEAIDYSSKMNVYIIAKNGIYDNTVWTQRYVGSTDNRYKMILDDKTDVNVELANKIIDFSNNTIVYDSNAERNIENDIMNTLSR